MYHSHTPMTRTSEQTELVKAVRFALLSAARKLGQSNKEWHTNIQALFEGFDYDGVGVIERQVCK